MVPIDSLPLNLSEQHICSLQTDKNYEQSVINSTGATRRPRTTTLKWRGRPVCRGLPFKLRGRETPSRAPSDIGNPWNYDAPVAKC